MPELNERLFIWARSDNLGLRSAALAALSNIRHECVGNYARHMLISGNKTCSEALPLLRLNYIHNDVNLIMSAIEETDNELNDIHSIGVDIISIGRESKTNEISPALLWVYENTPCSCCRHESVTILHELGKLPTHILNECTFDAYPDIRKYAEQCIR